MKKKIILIVIGAIILLVSIFSIVDYYRANSGKTPIFTIRTAIYRDGGSRSYLGLGYRVVRCNTLSGDKSVHFGSFNLSVGEVCKTHNFKIVDETEDCDDALETFYKDEVYEYYFECIKSSTVLVHFTDGEIHNIKEALENDMITIEEIEEYLKDLKKKPIFNKRPINE